MQSLVDHRRLAVLVCPGGRRQCAIQPSAHDTDQRYASTSHPKDDGNVGSQEERAMGSSRAFYGVFTIRCRLAEARLRALDS